MHRFLINYSPLSPKKRKTETEKLDQQRKYEKEGRAREFLPKWSTEFPWLQHTASTGMKCTICVKYDTNGTFVTGCKNYKKHNITSHEKSEGHKQCVNT